MTGINDVIAYIHHEANEHDITGIVEAMKLRRKMINAERASTINIGDTVRLDGLSPKALNGTRGEVTSINAQRTRTDIELDQPSCVKLALSRTRFARVVSIGATSYLLRGVPISCCIIEEES